MASLDMPLQQLTVTATSGDGISRISNFAQQAAHGIDVEIVHQQSTSDDHLEQARQTLDKVAAESVAANETGMGTGLAADTETVGPQALAAQL